MTICYFIRARKFYRVEVITGLITLDASANCRCLIHYFPLEQSRPELWLSLRGRFVSSHRSVMLFVVINSFLWSYLSIGLVFRAHIIETMEFLTLAIFTHCSHIQHIPKTHEKHEQITIKIFPSQFFAHPLNRIDCHIPPEFHLLFQWKTNTNRLTEKTLTACSPKITRWKYKKKKRKIIIDRSQPTANNNKNVYQFREIWKIQLMHAARQYMPLLVIVMSQSMPNRRTKERENPIGIRNRFFRELWLCICVYI